MNGAQTARFQIPGLRIGDRGHPIDSLRGQPSAADSMHPAPVVYLPIRMATLAITVPASRARGGRSLPPLDSVSR